ncbi:FAD/NAD(P)-binding oxidoreductase [Terrarubrum flagellatum]|uniref:FAD/NAD(P)-dependent oxidoreductase n=1 Tax=Terrirubrum flagellatum TaxID=2895980 RepID=UPI0031456F02
MATPRIVIVGAGPAGVRAAETFARAGLRPIVIDEGVASGGQIYRRQPAGFTRAYRALYGFEARRARALHDVFDALADKIDYRPQTLVWNIYDGAVHAARDGVTSEIAFDILILATGATDRLIPVRGWTKPGCYSLGAAQIALKAQACAIGRRVAFVGTGPLLTLVAYQYAKAGVDVAAVLDTSPFAAQIRALPDLASRPDVLAKGLYYRAALLARGVRMRYSVTPIAIEGKAQVERLRYRVGDSEETLDCDAVGLGFHLRSETQLADLARCRFGFDSALGQWAPETDEDGRSSVTGVYLAGDGARVLGADGAEIAGRLAALAALRDCGLSIDDMELAKLRRGRARMERFRRGLATAFPWPAHLARDVADDVVVCRCEVLTAGQIREVATAKDAPEMNRAKALSRIGMGRCQGRFCGHAAAEILSAARNAPLESVGRLRGQAPVKPLTISLVKEAAAEPVP